MFSLALLLHLHQPPTQFPEVLKQVTDQSYKPLLTLLEKYPQARLTLNLTASLIEQLDRSGFASGFLKSLDMAVRRGQVELTGTAAYHILLPKLPESEIIRQITLNELTLYKYLGVVGPVLGRKLANGELENWRIRKSVNQKSSPPVLQSSNPPTLSGFFPPEMGIDSLSAALLYRLGYQWVIVDEGAVDHNCRCDRPTQAWKSARNDSSSHSGQAPETQRDCHAPLAMTKERIKVVVRNKEMSLRLAFGAVTTVNDFLASAITSTLYPKPSLVLAMDGETFGHHQPKLISFLEDLMKNSNGGDYQMVKVSEIVDNETHRNQILPEVKIRSSTWSDDWLKWHDPDNEIHQLQWKLTELAIKTVNESQFRNDTVTTSTSSVIPVKTGIQERVDPRIRGDDKEAETGKQQWFTARSLLDKALHSDQYWWASLRPNWHYQLVERGARMLRDAALGVPDLNKAEKILAESLYEKIIKTGLEKYGKTVIV